MTKKNVANQLQVVAQRNPRLQLVSVQQAAIAMTTAYATVQTNVVILVNANCLD